MKVERDGDKPVFTVNWNDVVVMFKGYYILCNLC